MDIGEQVWNITESWESFAQNTVGRQFVRSADSIAANIAEGFGRYHFKENRQHCYYARGSLWETATWLKKAARRGLVDASLAEPMQSELSTLGVKLNNYIKSIGSGAASVRESTSDYE